MYKPLDVLIRMYADLLGEEWFFNGRLDDDDKRTNAADFAMRLRALEAFANVSERRLYSAICHALKVAPEGITGGDSA